MTPEEQFADIREMIAAQVEIGRRTDARLESIAERHAALAQSVELLTHAQRDTEAFLREHFAQMAGAIQRLARIAEIHEGRLDEHQQGLDDLEK